MSRMVGYRAMIDWIALNDDTEFLRDEYIDGAQPPLSVTAAMAADLFGKDDAVVFADLERAVKRMRKRQS